MNRLYSNKLFLVLLILSVSKIVCSQTYYYKLTKKIENGNQYENTAGGQFVTFEGEFCFDSDKYGISIGNGVLKLNREYSKTCKNYIGNSYFGTATYRFKSDLSMLNIIVNNNLIYVYKRTSPPANQITSSLIQKGKSSNSFSIQNVSTSIGSLDIYDSNNNLKTNTGNNTKRQKTKVRKQCAYCSGKGERIQHESVTTFGLEGPRVYCNKCNQSWHYGTVHAHHKCNHCNGTGYYEYEY